MMCELFGMSSRYPTTAQFSLRAFENHWKIPKRKTDGWGIAIGQRRDFLLVKEPCPAGHSETLHFLENNSVRSGLLISHLRYAGPGAKKKYVNTQPFMRELFGRQFVFAHNGLIRRIIANKRFVLGRFQPMGETDSEYAFCYLLDRLQDALSKKTIRNYSSVAALLNKQAVKINRLGSFNFLLSDSDYLYAYRSTKLYMANRDCICRKDRLKGGDLSIKMGPSCPSKNQNVSLVATMPLTKDNCWRELPLKKVVVFKKGQRLQW